MFVEWAANELKIKEMEHVISFIGCLDWFLTNRGWNFLIEEMKKNIEEFNRTSKEFEIYFAREVSSALIEIGKELPWVEQPETSQPETINTSGATFSNVSNVNWLTGEQEKASGFFAEVQWFIDGMKSQAPVWGKMLAHPVFITFFWIPLMIIVLLRTLKKRHKKN